MLDLIHLLWDGDEELLEVAASQHHARCREVAEECEEAMFYSAEQILANRSHDLANLIHEVVTILREIAGALQKVNQIGGDLPDPVVLEGPTLHYLFRG